MQYNNQQSVATLIYCDVCELIPGPLEKLVIHMVLMATNFSAPLMISWSLRSQSFGFVEGSGAYCSGFPVCSLLLGLLGKSLTYALPPVVLVGVLRGVAICD
jgi:hypothetical protein